VHRTARLQRALGSGVMLLVWARAAKARYKRAVRRIIANLAARKAKVDFKLAWQCWVKGQIGRVH
jgi:hypothetical protein